MSTFNFNIKVPNEIMNKSSVQTAISDYQQNKMFSPTKAKQNIEKDVWIYLRKEYPLFKISPQNIDFQNNNTVYATLRLKCNSLNEAFLTAKEYELSLVKNNGEIIFETPTQSGLAKHFKLYASLSTMNFNNTNFDQEFFDKWKININSIEQELKRQNYFSNPEEQYYFWFKMWQQSPKYRTLNYKKLAKHFIIPLKHNANQYTFWSTIYRQKTSQK